MAKSLRPKKGHLLSYFGLLAQLACLSLLQPVGAEENPPVTKAQSLKLAVGNADALKLTQGAAALQSAQPITAAADAGADAEADEPIDLLGEFNITSTRRRITERDNSQTTYAVTREDIKRSGAPTVGDALKLVPGVRFADDLGGVDNTFTNFNSVRGLDDGRFVVLQDGRPLTRPDNSRNSGFSKIGVQNIERIEVVSGGGTLRYGADAISGVINIVTRSPEGPPKVYASVNLGSYGFSEYTVQYSGSNQLPKTESGYFAYQLEYQRRSVLNNFNQNLVQNAPAGGDIQLVQPGFSLECSDGTPFVTNQPCTGGNPPFTYNGKAFGYYAFSDYYFGKVIFKPGKAHTVTVLAQQQNTQRGFSFYISPFCSIRPEGFVTPGGTTVTRPFTRCYTQAYYDDSIANSYFGYSKPYDYSKQDETGVNLSWDWELSELNTLNTQLSYNNIWDNRPAFNIGGRRYNSGRILEGQVNYLATPYKGNNLSAGIQFRTTRNNQSPTIGAPLNEEVDAQGGLTAVPFDREVSRYAIFVIEDLKFFEEALVVNLGARTTVDNQFGVFTTLGGGVRYNFGGPTASTAPLGFRFNWQQSFRAPSLSQLYSAGGNILPNPNLKPELGVNYDIGLDYQLSSSALLRATYYRIDLSNSLVGVTIESDTGQRKTQTVNAQGSLSTGVEIAFDWKINPNWRFQLTHSFIDARPVGNRELDPGANLSPPAYIQNGLFYGYQNRNVPFYASNVRFSYTTPGLDLTLNGRFEGERVQRGKALLGAYSTWDLISSVPLTSVLTLNAGIYNILGTRYELFSTFLGYTNPGTTFRVGVESTF